MDMQFCSRNEVYKYFESLAGMSLGLETMRLLIEAIGLNEPKGGYIHVTGTNGKGSTAGYIANALSKNQYKTGLYTSPCVGDFKENIVIDGCQIADEDLCEVAGEVASAACKLACMPTRFEVETAVALKYFEMCKCVFVVLEVGLGGALDATNIVSNTRLAVFCPISCDHQSVLGGTYAAIADAKAGIIKPDCTVVSAKQEPFVERIIRKRAADKACNIVMARKCMLGKSEPGIQRFIFENNEYASKMLGGHQKTNLGLAIECLEVLQKQGLFLDKNKTKEGIEGVRLSGRFESLGASPNFILDGAHNLAAAVELNKNINRYNKKNGNVYMVFGMFKDKDISNCLNAMLPNITKTYTFDWKNERAMRGEDIRDIIERKGRVAEYCNNITLAVSKALSDAASTDMIVACGSFSHLEEARRAYFEMRR